MAQAWIVRQHETSEANPSGLSVMCGDDPVAQVDDDGDLCLGGGVHSAPADLVAELLDRWRAWASMQAVNEGRMMQSNPVTDLIVVRGLLAERVVESKSGVRAAYTLCMQLDALLDAKPGERDDADRTT